MKRQLLVSISAVAMLYALLFVHERIKGVGISGVSSINLLQMLIAWPVLIAAQLGPAYFLARLVQMEGWLAGALLGSLVIIPAAADVAQQGLRFSGVDNGVLIFSPVIERLSWAVSFVMSGAFAGALGQARRPSVRQVQLAVQPEVPEKLGHSG